MQRIIVPLLIILLSYSFSYSQQVPDKNWSYEVKDPTYLPGKGPVIAIDEAHNNFHTREGRYYSFGQLLESDGFRVVSNTEDFTARTLEQYEILVISNAVNDDDTAEWVLPNPSAFTRREVQSLVDWVDAGGKLFLIADHMPFPGAASVLAERFGYEFNNGFAFEEGNNGPSQFKKDDNSLADNTLTSNIETVASFMGQGFLIPEGATPILQLDSRFTSLMPERAWDFNDRTEKISLDGWYQGAVSDFGNGKLVVFGEAAMFTTQLAGEEQRPMGMNHPAAKDNAQLLLNLIRWLEE